MGIALSVLHPLLRSWLGSESRRMAAPHPRFLVRSQWLLHFLGRLDRTPRSILIGLVLLVDFAHSWTETCLENWENSDSNIWQWVLVGSTAGTYGADGWLLRGAGVHAQPVRDHGQTAPLYLITVLCVYTAVQEAHPRSNARIWSCPRWGTTRTRCGTRSCGTRRSSLPLTRAPSPPAR